MKLLNQLLLSFRLDPKDFHSYAKLIQIYYHKKEYEKAKPYKNKLYEAYKKGELEDNLKDMFCFDQFKWKNKLIQAYERYEEGSKDIYNKHLFYVVGQGNNIEFRIQTVIFANFTVEQGESKYLLCRTKRAMLILLSTLASTTTSNTMT